MMRVQDSNQNKKVPIKYTDLAAVCKSPNENIHIIAAWAPAGKLFIYYSRLKRCTATMHICHIVKLATLCQSHFICMCVDTLTFQHFHSHRHDWISFGESVCGGFHHFSECTRSQRLPWRQEDRHKTVIPHHVSLPQTGPLPAFLGQQQS